MEDPLDNGMSKRPRTAKEPQTHTNEKVNNQPSTMKRTKLHDTIEEHRPRPLLQAKPKRTLADPQAATDGGLAGPPAQGYDTFELQLDWTPVTTVLDGLEFEASGKPAVSGKGECIGLRAKGNTPCITHETSDKTQATLALNWMLRQEPMVKQERLIWTSWQINVDSVSQPHSDSNNIGRSCISAMGTYDGG